MNIRPRNLEWNDSAGSHILNLVWVPGTEGVPYGFGHGEHRRPIDIEGFFMAATPVTQELWTFIMGENPAFHKGNNLPVDNVSWDQITGSAGFLERVNSSEVSSTVSNGEDAFRFRLPSESEWEYAARGGPHWKEDLAFSGSNEPDEVAWYGRRWRRLDQLLISSLGWPIGWRVANRIRKIMPLRTESRPVAEKAANQLGLYDMSGNVWEWCEDTCTEELDAIPNTGLPYVGPGDEKRLRGGCHHNWDLHCRVWWRYGIEPGAHDGCIGFRLVLGT